MFLSTNGSNVPNHEHNYNNIQPGVLSDVSSADHMQLARILSPHHAAVNVHRIFIIPLYNVTLEALSGDGNMLQERSL